MQGEKIPLQVISPHSALEMEPQTCTRGKLALDGRVLVRIRIQWGMSEREVWNSVLGRTKYMG